MSSGNSSLKKYFHTSRRFLAKNWLNLFHPVQIGITGSQGKTNTTEIVGAVLQKFGSLVRTDLSLDTTYNVPITALKVRPWTKFVVWELGIDHIGEMDNHHEIASPTISCVTGISPVHTDKEHMGSLKNLIAQKRRIIEHLPKNGTAVLNRDNEYVLKMAPFTKAKVLWYGSTPDCDIYVDKNSIKVSADGTMAKFKIKNGSELKDMVFETPLIGTHHVYNIMCAYLICQSALPDANILPEFKKVLKTIRPLPGRMSFEKGPLDTLILNDSLRANPESTNSGLQTLKAITYSKGRKIAVIGEMGELEEPEKEHQKTGELLAKLNLDLVLCIGPLRKFTLEEAISKGLDKNKIAYASDVFEASEFLRENLKAHDLWYLKGSLLRNYKRIIKLLNNEEVCCKAIICPYSHCK